MSNSWESLIEKTFQKQIEIEKKSILDYNSDIKEFINLSVQEENINIILVYGITSSTSFSHIYRMAIYPKTSTEKVYRSGNAVDGKVYDIQDVKKRAKTYLGHFMNQL
jgi:hypothetical protein